MIWLRKDLTSLALADGKPGHPAVFPDAAIRHCLTVKALLTPDVGLQHRRIAQVFCAAQAPGATPAGRSSPRHTNPLPQSDLRHSGPQHVQAPNNPMSRNWRKFHSRLIADRKMQVGLMDATDYATTANLTRPRDRHITQGQRAADAFKDHRPHRNTHVAANSAGGLHWRH